MDKDLIQHIAVPQSRLAPGVWEDEREIGEGDIHASYSADVIARENRIRAPFRHGSHLWACVSIRGGGHCGPELEAYRLMPETMFAEPITTYNAKVRADGGDAARNDSKGFYHGMAVMHGGMRYVLTGPPSLFLADPQAQTLVPAQLDLFACEAQP
jgi:hypothetical protein